jgi:hypothetical protein
MSDNLPNQPTNPDSNQKDDDPNNGRLKGPKTKRMVARKIVIGSFGLVLFGGGFSFHTWPSLPILMAGLLCMSWVLSLELRHRQIEHPYPRRCAIALFLVGCCVWVLIFISTYQPKPSRPLPAGPTEEVSHSPSPSAENAVTKEDLQAFSEQIQKRVSELKREGMNTNFPGDGLPGFSSHYLLRLGKPVTGQNSFIFDAGENTERNRFSIFIDSDENLCCRVIDKDSKPIEVKVAPGLDTFLFGNVMYLVCEYGSTDDFSCVRIIINGRQVAETNQTVPILISQPVISYGTFIGANMNGTNGAIFFALLDAASHETWRHVDLEQMMKDVYDFKVNPKTGIGGGISFNGTGYGQTAPTKPN